jgi:Mor family transcriptional regulator
MNTKKLTEDIEKQIIEDYHKGFNKQQLSNKYNFSITTICRVLKDIHIPRKFMNPEVKQQIIIDYLSEYPYDTLVLKYGLTKQKLYSIVNGHTHLLTFKKTILSDKDIEQIKKDYKNGYTFKDIHNKYNITRYKLLEITSEERKERKKVVTKTRPNQNYDYINEAPFFYSHTGLDGQKVYKFIGTIRNKNLYIELIDQNGEWVYHCENNKGLVCDSRISNRSYDSMLNCKIALHDSLERKKYFKK